MIKDLRSSLTDNRITENISYGQRDNIHVKIIKEENRKRTNRLQKDNELLLTGEQSDRKNKQITKNLYKKICKKRTE